MKNKVFIIIILFGIFFSKNNAQDFDVNYPWLTDIREYLLWYDTYSSATTASVAGISTATIKNIDAVRLNPAMIALVHRTTAELNFSYNRNNSDLTYNGTLSNFDKKTYSLSSLGIIYSYPVYKGSFSLAFGYLKLKNFNLSTEFDGSTKGYNNDFPAILEHNTEDRSGKLGTYFISGAVQFSKKAYLGATLNFLSGNYNYLFKIMREDYQNNYHNNDFAYMRKFEYEDKISGFSLDFGLLYEINEKLRFALVLNSPMWIHVNEDHREYYYAEDDINYYYYDEDIQDVWQGYSYNVTVPFKLSFGLSYDINKKLTISTDLSFIDYSSISYTKEPFENMDLKHSADKFYNTGTEYGISAKYFILRDISINGGFKILTIPYKIGREAYYNQYDQLEFVALNNEDNIFTAGLGCSIYLDKSLNLNIGYNYEQYKLSEPKLEEEYTNNNLIIGLSFRF